MVQAGNRFWRAVAGAAAGVAVIAAQTVFPVYAQPVTASAVDGWASYVRTGATTAWGGSATVDVAGFPEGALASNATTFDVVSGATRWLGPTTPPGMVFGASQDNPYLSFGTTTSLAPSDTTITFAVPTPSQAGSQGWGFVLGDVDAEVITISATDPAGNPVPTADLGWQGAFNYCNVSPKPSGCPAGTSTDVPTWDPAAATLTGNITDTDGAAGWFRPTVPLGAVTFNLEGQSGFPRVQLWVGAAGETEVTGSVVERTPSGDNPLANVGVALLDSAGNPVVVGGEPVVATTAADGTYTFTGLAPSNYRVRIDPPAGLEVVGPLPAVRNVNASSGAPVVVTAYVLAAPAPGPGPTPGPGPAPGPGPTPGPGPAPGPSPAPAPSPLPAPELVTPRFTG